MEITHKRQSLYNYDFWTGAALVGGGIATAGLGAYGADKDILIGAAIGVGTIVGARTYVPIADRQKIYGAALTAIDGAIDGSSQMETNSDKQEYEMKVDSFAVQDETIRDMEAAIDVGVFRMQKQVEKTESLAASFNTNRASLLRKALKAIVQKTNNSLSAEVLDPNAAIAAATNEMASARAAAAYAKDKSETLLESVQSTEDVVRILISSHTAGKADEKAKLMKSQSASDFDLIDDRIGKLNSRLEAINP